MKNKFGKYLYWILAIFPFILSSAFYSQRKKRIQIKKSFVWPFGLFFCSLRLRISRLREDPLYENQ